MCTVKYIHTSTCHNNNLTKTTYHYLSVMVCTLLHTITLGNLLTKKLCVYFDFLTRSRHVQYSLLLLDGALQIEPNTYLVHNAINYRLNITMFFRLSFVKKYTISKGNGLSSYHKDLIKITSFLLDSRDCNSYSLFIF